MSSKDVGIRIRVEKELRDTFQAACRSQERAASDVLRDFMRAFAEKQQHGQGDLFVVASSESGDVHRHSQTESR